MNFPNIDPTAFEIFGWSIKWYGISYAAGFLAGLTYAKYLAKKNKILCPKIFEDIFIWTALGAIIGGRLGYAVFYDSTFYLNNLILVIIDIRKGGMSFHGGLIGVIFACYIFCKVRKLSLLSIMDIIACCAPIGILFGRLANFVNAELWGKKTSMPWGIIFPNAGLIPRHPSQLYEAVLEGLVLLIIMTMLYMKMNINKGFTAAYFLILYGFFRILSEFFREPDSHIGYLGGDFITLGMLLSLPMILIGIALLKVSLKCQKN